LKKYFIELARYRKS